MSTTNCFICNASIPNIEGPVSSQKYLPQSPGCWKLYTDVLAKEYGEWQYPDIHRLTVDCYAAQHPTVQPDQKSAQSVTVHLIAIYFALEKNMTSKDITKRMGEIVSSHKGEFDWLEPPENLGVVTISDVHKAKNFDEHLKLVTQWAHSIWDAWREYHRKILELANYT
jgi:hypothetical protein